MKLNNKGFAISAILYALLILFTLTLISLITGLNSRNRILEKSIETVERKYNWSCKYKDDPTAQNISEIRTTQYRGKYIFSVDGEISYDSSNECSTYLEKSIDIRDPKELIFTNPECNNKENLELIAVCY